MNEATVKERRDGGLPPNIFVFLFMSTTYAFQDCTGRKVRTCVLLLTTPVFRVFPPDLLSVCDAGANSRGRRRDPWVLQIYRHIL